MPQSKPQPQSRSANSTPPIKTHHQDHKIRKSSHHEPPDRLAQPRQNKNTNTNTNTNTHTKSKPRTNPDQGSSSSNRCWDWIITGGNTHYAKNRSSFLSYRRAPGKIAGARVLGVGTVRLKVRRAPDDDRLNVLDLHDVLHMPNARCNGLSLSKYREMNPSSAVEEIERERDYFQARDEVQGEALWYGEEYCGLSRVVLWGDPRGQSYLRDDGRVYLLSIIAPREEMEKLHTRVEDRSF